MEGLKSRAVALIVCIALILVGWFGGTAIQNMSGNLITAQASGLKANTVVMQIGDQEITAGEYLYWLTSACDVFYQYYGITDWDMALTDDMTVGEYVMEQADYYVSQYAAIRQMSAEMGIGLSEEQQAEMDNMHAYYVDYYGGEEMYAYMLAYAGLNEDLLYDSNMVPFLYVNVCDQLLGEGGALEPTDENLQTFAQTHGYTGLSDEELLMYYEDTSYGAPYDYVNTYIDGMEVIKTEHYDDINVATFYPALLTARENLVMPTENTGSTEEPA